METGVTACASVRTAELVIRCPENAIVLQEFVVITVKTAVRQVSARHPPLLV